MSFYGGEYTIFHRKVTTDIKIRKRKTRNYKERIVFLTAHIYKYSCLRVFVFKKSKKRLKFSWFGFAGFDKYNWCFYTFRNGIY